MPASTVIEETDGTRYKKTAENIAAELDAAGLLKGADHG